MSVQTETEEVKPSEPIWITITLKNVSDKDIVVAHTSFCDYQIEVKDEAGNPAALIKYATKEGYGNSDP